MKASIVLLIQTVFVASLLSACGQKQPSKADSPPVGEQPVGPDVKKSDDNASMPSDMPMSANGNGAVQEHSATGMVTGVDMAAGTITIAHGAVASAGWPAMTMTFKLANPEQASALHANDHVKFSFTLNEKQDATVTSISPGEHKM